MQYLTVSDFDPHKPQLVHKVFRSGSDRNEYLYRVKLADISTIEVGLSDGRFKHFSYEMQEHMVAYDMRVDMQTAFEERLNWISHNVKYEWSFELHMKHVSEGRMRWTFADRTEAILFKLSF